MSTQKAKFQLFARLQALGFTYEEAQTLYRAEKTLQRWAEAECNGEIQREETLDAKGWDTGDGKPYRVYEQYSSAKHYPIADREAGALKRCHAIVAARNDRLGSAAGKSWGNYLVMHHQTDPRGCALYLVKRSDIPTLTREEWLRNQPADQSDKAFASAQGRQIESYYTRGLAVCC